MVPQRSSQWPASNGRYSLGLPLHSGLTAYVGLAQAARLRPGDAVFVSSAAGATGSMAGQRLNIRGFTVRDHLDLAPEFGSLTSSWLADGSLVYTETVIDGLTRAPRALLDLIGGAYLGKTVVRLAG